jgi:hypothetical protein
MLERIGNRSYEACQVDYLRNVEASGIGLGHLNQPIETVCGQRLALAIV